MQFYWSLCKYGDGIGKTQIMIVVNEVGRQKCVMEIYVENWKFWMDYGLMEILYIL